MPWRDLDPLLSSVGELVAGLADASSGPEQDDRSRALWVHELAIETPIELGLEVDDDQQVRLAMAPPTQRLETTVLPVFHRLSLRIACTKDGHDRR